MVSAISAIANGGLLYRPQVVLGLQTGEGFSEASQPEPRRVVRETTAATMRHMLEGVVLNGTGRLARLDGYTAGGKTGTAQKLDPGTGRYSQSELIASFVGFAPLNTPAVTILVQLDSPVGPHEGGQVAAPVFKRVAEQVLAYLNVPQDVPVLSKTLRAQSKTPEPASLADVSDFTPAEPDSAPAPPLPAAGSAPLSTVDLGDSDGVTVPLLVGKTVREVIEICQKLGLNPVLVGSGIVLEQEPLAGTAVARGGNISLRFGRSGSARAAMAPRSLDLKGRRLTAMRAVAER
jgi:membrane peptidoglycan carboxypeptidase